MAVNFAPRGLERSAVIIQRSKPVAGEVCHKVTFNCAAACACIYRKRGSSKRTCKCSPQRAIPASGRLPCTECVRICRLPAVCYSLGIPTGDRYDPGFFIRAESIGKVFGIPGCRSRNPSLCLRLGLELFGSGPLGIVSLWATSKTHKSVSASDRSGRYELSRGCKRSDGFF